MILNRGLKARSKCTYFSLEDLSYPLFGVSNVKMIMSIKTASTTSKGSN